MCACPPLARRVHPYSIIVSAAAPCRASPLGSAPLGRVALALRGCRCRGVAVSAAAPCRASPLGSAPLGRVALSRDGCRYRGVKNCADPSLRSGARLLVQMCACPTRYIIIREHPAECVSVSGVNEHTTARPNP